MRIVSKEEVLMKNGGRNPTDAELEILQILWKEEPCTVRIVNDLLNEIRKIGYTTTLKMMQIMHEKGILSRDEKNRSHLYSARIKESETQHQLLNKLVKSAFGGSALKLVVSALGNQETSEEEITKIKKFLDSVQNNAGRK
jgi:predicted transcriptional regulator